MGRKGIIKERPLGVVVTYPDMKAKPIYPPEETDKYNITQIRCGVVELTEKSSDWMNDESGTCKLHLSRYDGGFYVWDNIERIGSVYDIDCLYKFNFQEKGENMFTVDNKFEIGEECYSVYRKPTHYECPICKGKGRFLYNGYDIWCKNCGGSGKLHNPKQFVMEVCKVKVRRIKVSRYEEVNSIKYVVTPVEPALANVKNRGENNLFKTIEEAEKYCVEVNTKQISPEF